ncbi:MAG: methyltransferase domain-containing protein [Acidobacteriia bacterium]|nr:methyltransferase domain-containing protein [Terriglobia bacterium]
MKLETNNTQPGADSAYILDNAARETPVRFDALSAIYDRATIQHLENIGVGPGWKCLEVGGGGGSIAAWLAARVGSTGHVLVTDLDPRFLEPLQAPNLEVCRHNIASEPLPEAAFDLIHARLVLVHLPKPEKVLVRLVAALKPGGYLIDEEFDSASLRSDPAVSPGEIQLKSQIALFRLSEERGLERRWGRLLYGRLRALGLVDVSAEARLFMWHGGSVGTSLMRANFEQLHDPFIAGGHITEQELQQDLVQLDSPDFMMPSPTMWTAWGRRPPAL